MYHTSNLIDTIDLIGPKSKQLISIHNKTTLNENGKDSNFIYNHLHLFKQININTLSKFKFLNSFCKELRFHLELLIKQLCNSMLDQVGMQNVQ